MLKPYKVNWFLLFKLPSAWFCGVRLKSIDASRSQVTVKHRWINQNPFKSLYFAVQNMAAELSTGVLVMQAIQSQNQKVSMLVIEAHSEFFKKATGRIRFKCHDGQKIDKIVHESIRDITSKQMTLFVEAFDKNDVMVSKFNFTWSVKPKD
ncbi:DUF4442 domain-containing protein [Flavobacteriaceae bacterium 14752]|uniref:DUF4442 domain-containing protein n=1 Tax=Mesohalobacter salilacus TaxID=2491711 RepID=UPI000F641775|nr:DUF4442 domain-containing protein [Flavobacteriaceae bacterium 14752]